MKRLLIKTKTILGRGSDELQELRPSIIEFNVPVSVVILAIE